MHVALKYVDSILSKRFLGSVDQSLLQYRGFSFLTFNQSFKPSYSSSSPLLASLSGCYVPIAPKPTIRSSVRYFSTSPSPTLQPRKFRERAAPIVLTENAAKRIKSLLEGKDSNIVGVRISVRRRGCNGYSYTMNYATKDDVKAKKDEIVEAYGVTVLVDPKAIFFLVGTVMDYEETALSAEFTFNNPNSKGQCGCGESFNV